MLPPVPESVLPDASDLRRQHLVELIEEGIDAGAEKLVELAEAAAFGEGGVGKVAGSTLRLAATWSRMSSSDWRCSGVKVTPRPSCYTSHYTKRSHTWSAKGVRVLSWRAAASGVSIARVGASPRAVPLTWA